MLDIISRWLCTLIVTGFTFDYISQNTFLFDPTPCHKTNSTIYLSPLNMHKQKQGLKTPVLTSVLFLFSLSYAYLILTFILIVFHYKITRNVDWQTFFTLCLSSNTVALLLNLKFFTKVLSLCKASARLGWLTCEKVHSTCYAPVTAIMSRRWRKIPGV